jgi:hypothetical protein
MPEPFLHCVGNTTRVLRRRHIGVHAKPIALCRPNNALRFAEVADVYGDHRGTALGHPSADCLTDSTPGARDCGHPAFMR